MGTKNGGYPEAFCTPNVIKRMCKGKRRWWWRRRVKSVWLKGGHIIIYQAASDSGPSSGVLSCRQTTRTMHPFDP